jgi:hypothetical protein
VINKLFGTFAAKAAVVALAGGFATGGLVAAGAFTGGAAHVAGARALMPETSSKEGGTQAKVAVEATSSPTVAAPEDKSTSTVKADPDEHHGLPTATVTPKPVRPTSSVQDNDADEGVTGTVEADDADDAATGDHGNCVAYAASILRTLGLTGEQNGAFVSLVARDRTAVTSKVAAGGIPDAACLTAMAKAKVAALAAAVTATDDHGHDGANHDGTNHDGATNVGGNHETTQHQGSDDKGGAGTTATTTSASTGDPKGGHH